MKFIIIACVLALANVYPALAKDADHGIPAAGTKLEKTEPGIPVQSTQFLSELILIHQSLIEMRIQQIKTNRLLSIAATRPIPGSNKP